MASISLTPVIIPTIHAKEEQPTISERILSIKKFFGGPRWLRDSKPKPQSIESNVILKQTYLTTFGRIPNSPTVFLQTQTVEAKREQNLIALMEVSRLSKASKPTIKDKIFKLVESRGALGATAAEIAELIPNSVYKSVSSRVSEMVKSGTLAVGGKRFDGRGVEVNFYVISSTKAGN